MVEEPVGRHWVLFEPPDLCVIRPVGDLSVEEVSEIMSRVGAFAAGKQRVLLMFNVERSGDMAPAARKIAMDATSRLPVAGIALFGASFAIRVAATLMAKAARILYPSSAPVPRFFASEAEARAWLNGRRAAAAER